MQNTNPWKITGRDYSISGTGEPFLTQNPEPMGKE